MVDDLLIATCYAFCMINNDKHDWMQQLASHYKAIRALYPSEKLLVSFDIDGTIIDARHTVVQLLKQYDHEHGTYYFEGLTRFEIRHPENTITPVLEAHGVPSDEHEQILAWYFERCWSASTVLYKHRAFNGVLDVIGWFQRQPNTQVGLNTGRPEMMRDVTLSSLNQLGADFGVQFDNDMLHMNNQDNWEFNVGNSKAMGIDYFRAKGHRVVAAIDNEPESLKGLAQADPEGDILLLHADTLYMTELDDRPNRAIVGNKYNLAALVRTLVAA